MVTAVRTFNCKIEASALPAWIASQPLLKWFDIPNSIAAVGDGTTGLGIPSAFMVTRGFSRIGSGFVWGNNKFGSIISNPQQGPIGPWNTAHCIYGSGPWDRIRGRAIYGPGDTTWPENGIHMLELNHPSPIWVSEVVRATHQQDYKYAAQGSTDAPFDAVAHLNQDGSFNNPEFDRMYDGRPKASHLSWHVQYNSVRDWVVQVGAGQVYPWDSGAYTDVHIGDCAAGDWLDRVHVGYDAGGNPTGVTIPRIPTSAADYSPIITSGSAIGQKVANFYNNPCTISNDDGDMFIVANVGPRVYRLTNSLIGGGPTPWTPLDPAWFNYAGSPSVMRQLMSGGFYQNMALAWHETGNYLLMMGYSRQTSGFVTGIYDFNTPVTISGTAYPCTFHAGDEAGWTITFTGAAAAAVQGFNNYTTNSSFCQDAPVWNSDVGAFLWWESATGKVIRMTVSPTWVMNCDYLPMTAGSADPPVGWAGSEYRRGGWDFIPFLNLMVHRGPPTYPAGTTLNAPMKCFRTA